MADWKDLMNKEEDARESRRAAGNQTDVSASIAFMIEALGHEINALGMRLEIALREASGQG